MKISMSTATTSICLYLLVCTTPGLDCKHAICHLAILLDR
jgi:hypothetical protein